jgi:hypothetical protein
MFPGKRLWRTLGLLAAGLAGLLASDLPRLSITNAPGALEVSWPATTAEWVLDQADVLGTPVPWSRVASSQYETNAGRLSVRAPAPAGARFYRLRWASAANEALTGLWALDEGAGFSAADTAGVGAAMSLSNVSWRTGRVGSAGLWFESAAGRAWIDQAAGPVVPAGAGPFSISFWFNPASLSPGSQVLAATDLGGTNGWRLLLSTRGPGTNELVLAGGGAGGSLSVTGRTLLLPGQWRHLTATYSGSAGRVYLDGVLLAESTGVLAGSAGPLVLGGGLPGVGGFSGGIDDLRTHTNCLGPEWISLAGHWRFEEGGGGQAGDSGLWGHPAQLGPGVQWVPGRVGGGLLVGGSGLTNGTLMLSNAHRTLLPPDGEPFSVSFWYLPQVLPAGPSGLLHCGVAGVEGWEVMLEREAGSTWMRWVSTNRGGTLALRAPCPVGTGVWSRVDLTFNGGVATAYVDGRRVGSAPGAIRSTAAPWVVGSVPGLPSGLGVVDELQVHRHERAAEEIGPVAETMWETVLRNSATNVVLRVAGPAGRALTCALVPVVQPTNGTVSLDGAVVTYTAGARKGPDAFTYTVSDGQFTSPPTLVLMSVVEPHWLSPLGGTGGVRDGTAPERAWAAGSADALDAIWRTNNHYDCFFYAPGEYLTRGYRWRARTTVHPGCKHVGTASTGPGRTTIKLVDAAVAWQEEAIFSSQQEDIVDDFELHHLRLDCNGDNVPLHAHGEPVWLRVPLAGSGRVDTVTLRWRGDVAPGYFPWWFGRATDYLLEARLAGTTVFATNVVAAAGAGTVDVVPVGVVADEVLLTCRRLAAGANFYGLWEMEVAGGTPSLPTAVALPGGAPSSLDAFRTALSLADRGLDWVWASGPTQAVEITLPLEPGTRVTQMTLNWNCQTLGTNLQERLGPAADFSVRARSETNGAMMDVPLLRLPRSPNGVEVCRLGSGDTNQPLVTDRLVLVLSNRAPGVKYFSLREVTLQHGGSSVALRVPVASRQFYDSGGYGGIRALDGNPATGWGSGQQGTVGAVHAGGSNHRYRDLEIVGFGNSAGREGFPLHLVAPVPPTGGVRLGNVLVEDCRFLDPARGNADVLSALMLTPAAPNILTNAKARRCRVSGLQPHFPRVNAYNAVVHLEDSEADQVHVGAYYEPYYRDQFGPVLLRSNRFQNVSQGILVSPYPGVQSDSLTLLHNEIVLLPGGRGYGLSLCDVCNVGPSGSMTNLVAVGNVIRYPDWVPRPANGAEGGLQYGDIRHAVFARNLVALGTPNPLRVRQCPAGSIPDPVLEDCVSYKPAGPTTIPACLNELRPGYRRAFLGNRDLQGELLPVRFFENLVDGQALEQQWGWPE